MIPTSNGVAKPPDRFKLRGTQITFTRKAQVATGCLALALFLLHIATPLIWLTDVAVFWMVISPRVPRGVPGVLMRCGYIIDNGGRPRDVPPSPDCTIRAIAIAASRPYLQVRAELNCKQPVPRENERTYMTWLGFTWRTGPVPTTGRIVVDVEGCSKSNNGKGHTVAVIDNVVYDTFDSRDGSVIGYWNK